MSLHWIRPSFFCVLALVALPFVACDDSADDEDEVPPTPAERLCQALANAIQGCGSATPCDQALVKDCASIAGIMSDPYLEAAAQCIEGGGVPQQCFIDALAKITPTAAQKAFGQKFCSECALGIPGCEETLFGGGDGDTAIIGKLIMPFGDSLVGQLGEECASGLTCAATFLNCAQGVIVKRAIPDNTLKCLFDTLTGNIEPGMESDCSTANSSSATTGTGGSGMACVDGEDCGMSEVCDFESLRCAASQCASGMECAMGEVCIEQVAMSGSGACYPGCTPFGSGCAADDTCIDFTGEGQTGLCLHPGTSGLGQPCDVNDTSSGCVANHLCADQGNGFECLEQCNFWGASASCSNAAQSCIFQSACVDAGVVDSAGIGQSCSSPAGSMCGPFGARLLGSCQDLGAGLVCLAFCRTAASDCPGGETCTPFDDGTFGLCVP